MSEKIYTNGQYAQNDNISVSAINEDSMMGSESQIIHFPLFRSYLNQTMKTHKLLGEKIYLLCIYYSSDTGTRNEATSEIMPVNMVRFIFR